MCLYLAFSEELQFYMYIELTLVIVEIKYNILLPCNVENREALLIRLRKWRCSH